MIIFLYGEDDFLAKKKIKELKDKFFREIDPTGGAFSAFSAKELEMKNIKNSLGTASLLSSKRMLVLENIFASKTKEFLVELLEYLKEKEKDDNIIIIWQSNIKKKIKGARTEIVKVDFSKKDKALLVKEKKIFEWLSKQSFVQEFKKMSSIEIAPWIRNEFQKRGADISFKAVQELVSLVGVNLWCLDNEIDKLIAYKKGLIPKITEDNKKVQIDVEDIFELVKGIFDENIFALTDAISARNKVLALKILEEQYEAGLTDSYLISMIIRQVKILLKIRSGLDSELDSKQITSELKLHPFIIQKGINQVRNFNLETLKKMFAKLLDIDKDTKTGRGNTRTFLSIFLSKI